MLEACGSNRRGRITTDAEDQEVFQWTNRNTPAGCSEPEQRERNPHISALVVEFEMLPTAKKRSQAMRKRKRETTEEDAPVFAMPGSQP